MPLETNMEIAVVGMSGRYPGARTLARYWENLRSGHDAVREVPPSRWDVNAYFHPSMRQKGTIYCKWLGALDDIDGFDPLFFGISPADAEQMDPQHRLFLQEAYAAFEDGGFAPERLARSNCGVYLGIMSYEYGALAQRQRTVSATANSFAVAAARVAYDLDLKGPAISLDTACSSSLVATHLACTALAHGEIDMALVGGVSLYLTPESYIGMCGATMLSPDGRCKSFDEGADGFVPGEGAGAVVLKRLADAEADGDLVYGVIEGTGINQDGRTNGITAPNMGSQIALEREVYRKYGIDPERIGYVEMHGTGTKLGDPIELEALATVFRERTARVRYCAIGSAKSNIGHASAAAGMAGLHKVLLQLQHRQIAPSLHFRTPNTRFDFARSPFYVSTELHAWEAPAGTPRRAGVSSFGFSGTNAHLVVREYVPRSEVPRAVRAQDPAIFVLSARTEDRLNARAAGLLEWAESSPGFDVRDVAYTLQVGREAMDHRLAFVARTGVEVCDALRRFLAGHRDAGIVYHKVKKNKDALTDVESNDHLRDVLAVWVRKGMHAEIAKLWTKGLNLEWKPLLYAADAAPPRKVSLPTYPFVEERYWLPREVPSGGDGDPLAVTFTGQEPFFTDHVVDGRKVLPGAAYLELARRAVGASLATQGFVPMRLRNVVWIAPFAIEAGARELRFALSEAPGVGGGIAFEAHADVGGVRTAYCRGVGEALSSDEARAPVQDLAAWRRDCAARTVSRTECYDAFRARGLSYGPAHQAIEELHVGEGRVLARIALPASAGTALGRDGLHPSLADAALQACIGASWDPSRTEDPDTDPWLPFGIDAIALFAPVPVRVWACVRPRDEGARGDVRKIDIDVCADDGHVCARISGFSARRLRRASAPSRPVADAGALRLAPIWIATSAPRDAVSADEERQVLTLPLMDTDGAGADRYTSCVLRILEAIRALRERAAGKAARLQVVAGADGEGALLAGLSGLLRTAELELPRFAAQLVLVSGAPPDLARALQDDAGCPEDKEIAYHEGRRTVRRWRELSAPERAVVPWRDGGVYLITGGAGGMGVLFAREITERAKGATVVLAGRSAATPEIDARLSGLARNGGAILYESLDVTDPRATAELVARIESRYGALRGVLHGAGIMRDRVLVDKADDEVRAVLGPKVHGAANLDEATAASPLDVFLLFSSMAALGNPGQADYAAGNAFMDALSARRNAQVALGARSGRTLAIDWPLWRDGGMSMPPRIQERIRERTGLAAMSSAHGFAALYAALAEPEAQCLVLDGDAAKIRSALYPRLPVVADVPPAPSPSPEARRAALESTIGQTVGALLKVKAEDIDADTELTDYGFDSVSFTEFALALSTKLEFDLDPTLFFEHRTIAAIAEYMDRALPRPAAAPRAPEPQVPRADPPPDRPLALAIVGMSGAFPMANDVEAFWQNLAAGRDCVGEMPESRWARAAGEPVARGGFLDDVAAFDPLFFGISPKEAQMMDPQQRLLMMHVYAALEDAGYAPRGLAGSRTGVFVGTGSSGYSALLTQAGVAVEGFSSTGSTPSVGPNRMSFFLDLHGPSEPIETACSSSLVALHRAMESIASGSCDMAVVGGVNTIVSQDVHLSFDKAGMLAKDGRCKTFSAEADGYGRGEGVGMLVVKRLEDAEREGDSIYGIVRGTAVKHGGRATSLTAPNPKSQADLIRDAYRRSGVDPRTIGYIEAHGTGTKLGDPIEMNGLKAAFEAMLGDVKVSSPFCAIGSVKSNVGHLELAAGVAGIIKVLLQFRHETLVESLHCRAALNPFLKLEGSPFYVVRERTPWARMRDAEGREIPRRAGVSSFGFGGVNAHVVLEEYVPPPAPSQVHAPGAPELIVLSARDAAGLGEQARRLGRAIVERAWTEADLPGIAYGLQIGRDAMEVRAAFVVTSMKELAAKLDEVVVGVNGASGIHRGVARSGLAPIERDELARSMAGGALDAIADRWCAGAAVDWHRADPPRRVRLPSYAFARDRYWVEPGAKPSRAAAPREETKRGPSRRDRLVAYLKEQTAIATSLPAHRIEADAPLEKYGVDSLMAANLTGQLEKSFGPLSKTLLFEYRTVSELAEHLESTHASALDALFGATPAVAISAAERPVPEPPAQPALRGARAESAGEAVAIVAIAGRYPGAGDLDEFWEALCEGRDGVTEVPAARWSHAAIFDPEKGIAGKTYGRWGGFIDGADCFDAELFGISPREASLMDPEARLFLETSWELLERGGYTRERLRREVRSKVGVFVGSMYQHYPALRSSFAEESVESVSSYWAIANRVSHFFDLCGPSVAVDTACSSSLVSVHLACESLRRGECELAIAGGVNLTVHPKKYVGLAALEMLGSHADSRSFGAGDGYLPAEGVGAVLLKPLDRARTDGDAVLAVITSSAMNHGGQTSAFSVPNPDAQADLIEGNFRKAGIDPRTVSYVESAANGSALGDPLELAGLKKAFARFTADEGFCAIGSVKSNIGHAEAASGMSQLAKVVLQLVHRKLVPSIKSEVLNPNVSFDGTPFRLQTRLEDWARPMIEQGGVVHEHPRRATVSSLGAGGSNAHVILEELPDEEAHALPEDEGPELVVLSAKSRERLRALAERMVAYVERRPVLSLARVAHTLQIGREALDARLALVVRSRAELLEGLGLFLADRAASAGGPVWFSAEPDAESVETRSLLSGRAGESFVDDLIADGDLPKIALFWTRGGRVPWERLHPGRRGPMLALPTYPFARTRHWVGAPSVGAGEPVAVVVGAEPSPVRASSEAESLILAAIQRDLGIDRAGVSPAKNFRELGADSIFMVRLGREIERRLQVKVTGRALLEYRTVGALAAHVDTQRAPSPVAPVAPAAELEILDQLRRGALSFEEAKQLLISPAMEPTDDVRARTTS